MLKKMGWQKVEALREVKKELGLLEKQIWSGREKEFVEKERDQALEGGKKLAKKLKKLRKKIRSSEGVDESQREANILRDEGGKEKEASRG